MHIGIVANAPGRKKKMNREALPVLAVRAGACWIVVRGRINQSPVQSVERDAFKAILACQRICRLCRPRRGEM